MHRTSFPLVIAALLLAQGCGGAKMSGGAYRVPRADSVETTASASRDADGIQDSADEPAGSDRMTRPADLPGPPPPPASPGSGGEEAKKEAPGPRPQSPQLAQNQPPGSAPPRVSDARPDGRDSGKIHEKRSPVLIYTATFTMAVFEVAAGLREVERLALEAGGFLSKRNDKMIVIRVPAARFQEVVAKIEKAGDVIHRDVAAQDVTEEYLDTEIRLRNARAMRDRLEQLLARANTVQDSLMIERELARVAAEIDRMEGRLKFLRDRATFSTITVSFEARRTEAPPPSVRLPFSWLRQGGLGRLLSL